MTATDISKRWPNAGDYYAERDQRTTLEVEHLHRYVHRDVEIHVDPATANSQTTQRAALVAANLTARWARRIAVVVPDVPLAPPLDRFGEGSLASRIEREMTQADPFGAFSVDEHAPPPIVEPLRLHVGAWAHVQAHEADDLIVNAAAWSARVRRANDDPFGYEEEALPAAAALAGAIGAADLFKRAIQHPKERWIEKLEWCTWCQALEDGRHRCRSAPSVPGSIDLGELLIAGVGAIGSALLYVLGLGQGVGSVTVLDRDAVEVSNLNRSPLFTVDDALHARRKTEVAVRYCEALGLTSAAVDGTWRDHGEALAGRDFDAWVSLTNEDGAWAEVPFQLPPVVLHGTTTSGWGMAFGRHLPRVEDCTYCRLPRPHVEFRGPCAAGELGDVGTVEVAAGAARASLPFLSAASASVLASELQKLAYPEVRRLPNCVQADFMFGVPTLIASLRQRTAGCPGCAAADIPLWEQRRVGTRFAPLSIG